MLSDSETYEAAEQFPKRGGGTHCLEHLKLYRKRNVKNLGKCLCLNWQENWMTFSFFYSVTVKMVLLKDFNIHVKNFTCLFLYFEVFSSFFNQYWNVTEYIKWHTLHLIIFLDASPCWYFILVIVTINWVFFIFHNFPFMCLANSSSTSECFQFWWLFNLSFNEDYFENCINLYNSVEVTSLIDKLYHKDLIVFRLDLDLHFILSKAFQSFWSFSCSGLCFPNTKHSLCRPLYSAIYMKKD